MIFVIPFFVKKSLIFQLFVFQHVGFRCLKKVRNFSKKVLKKFGDNEKSSTFAIPFEKRSSEKGKSSVKIGIWRPSAAFLVEVVASFPPEKFLKKSFGDSEKRPTFADPFETHGIYEVH